MTLSTEAVLCEVEPQAQLAQPQTLAQGTVGHLQSHRTPDPAGMGSSQTHLSDSSPAHMAEGLQTATLGSNSHPQEILLSAQVGEDPT